MILSKHIPIFSEIFSLPGFLKDPVLTFGFQDVIFHDRAKSTLAEKRAKKEGVTLYSKMRGVLQEMTGKEYFDYHVPWQFMEADLDRILKNFGLENVQSLDLFDSRADWKHDMNLTVPESIRGRYATIIDIGSLEHVFDTRQCLHNLFAMLQMGGRLMLHTPCSGCFNHGFYTFSPEAIIASLKSNGFEIDYLAYSLEPEGFKLEKPMPHEDVLLWCVARKVREEKQFIIPQQDGCLTMYGNDQSSDGSPPAPRPAECHTPEVVQKMEGRSFNAIAAGQACSSHGVQPSMSVSDDAASVPQRSTLFLGLVEGNNYGWGVCSRYLIRELSRLSDCRVLNEADGSAQNGNLPGKLFQALTGVDFFPMFEKARGQQNFGYTFFENELTGHSLENSRRYDLVLGGSSWCCERMRERGIANCGVLIQGIDPEIFFPVDEEKDPERFVIFSGGKFELRKGQDLVLKACKILQSKYPDIWLVNCWYNIWPESMRLMAHSRHIDFEPFQGSWQDLMRHTYRRNGLDAGRIVTCDLMPAELQRELYRNTDIGVFPNRCEGGTNLVLMEYMACGKPVIASHTSGHTDVVNERNALLLKNLTGYNIVGPNREAVARWQEPSVDELVAQIEFAYHHRDEIRRRGRAAGEDMKRFTWRHTAEQLLALIYPP